MEIFRNPAKIIDQASQAPHSETTSDWYRLEILSLPSLSSRSATPFSYLLLNPYKVPEFPEDIIIRGWKKVATGRHGDIRKINFLRNGVERYACLKLFREESKAAYELEANAYALLTYRGVRRCIPDVWWRGAFPVSRWEGTAFSRDHNDEVQYGIVMEFLEESQEVDFYRLDLEGAEAIGDGLRRIHNAGVRHGAVFEHNILLVREAETVRIVWINFSSAHSCASEEMIVTEWDGFVEKLKAKMDRSLLTNSALQEKFQRRLKEPSVLLTLSDNDDMEPANSTMTVFLQRYAYSISLPYQLLLFLLPQERNMSPGEYLFSLPMLSIGIAFFIFQNETLHSKLGQQIACIFVTYNLVSSVLFVRELATSADDHGLNGVRGIVEKGLHCFGVCAGFWISITIVAQFPTELLEKEKAS